MVHEKLQYSERGAIAAAALDRLTQHDRSIAGDVRCGVLQQRHHDFGMTIDGSLLECRAAVPRSLIWINALVFQQHTNDLSAAMLGCTVHDRPPCVCRRQEPNGSVGAELPAGIHTAVLEELCGDPTKFKSD